MNGRLEYGSLAISQLQVRAHMYRQYRAEEHIGHMYLYIYVTIYGFVL